MNIYEYLTDNFKLFTKKEYNDYDLSTETKKILCDIGLPKEPLSFIQFDI